MQHVEAVVDEHPRRGVAAEDRPVGLALPVDRRRLWFPVARAGEQTGANRIGGEVRIRAGGARLPAVDPMLTIDRREQVRKRADGLRRAEEEEAVRVQRVMERRDHAFLQGWCEVDEQIAAADEVDARERRIGRDVLLGEKAHLPDGFADAVLVILAGEEAPQALGRDLRFDVLGIDALAGPLQQRLGEIGREHLNRGPSRLVLEEFQKRHHQRIRFLAGRASRHPDTDRRVRGLVLQDLGEDAVLERLESLGLAEEARDVDQDVLIQRLELRAILLQVPCVIGEIFLGMKHHAPHDAPPDRRIAITAEVDAERKLVSSVTGSTASAGRVAAVT